MPWYKKQRNKNPVLITSVWGLVMVFTLSTLTPISQSWGRTNHSNLKRELDSQYMAEWNRLHELENEVYKDPDFAASEYGISTMNILRIKMEQLSRLYSSELDKIDWEVYETLNDRERTVANNLIAQGLTGKPVGRLTLSHLKIITTIEEILLVLPEKDHNEFLTETLGKHIKSDNDPTGSMGERLRGGSDTVELTRYGTYDFKVTERAFNSGIARFIEEYTTRNIRRSELPQLRVPEENSTPKVSFKTNEVEKKTSSNGILDYRRENWALLILSLLCFFATHKYIIYIQRHAELRKQLSASYSTKKPPIRSDLPPEIKKIGATKNNSRLNSLPNRRQSKVTLSAIDENKILQLKEKGHGIKYICETLDLPEKLVEDFLEISER